MNVTIGGPITVDIAESQFASVVNKLTSYPSNLSDFADGLNDSILAYLTSYYIGKLKTDHPSDFDKLVRFMLGAKPEDEPVKKCPSGFTGNEKKKHEFEIGDPILVKHICDNYYSNYTIVSMTESTIYMEDRSTLPFPMLGIRTLTATKEELYKEHGKSLYIIGYDGG